MSERQIAVVKREYEKPGWKVVETYPVVVVAKDGNRVEIK